MTDTTGTVTDLLRSFLRDIMSALGARWVLLAALTVLGAVLEGLTIALLLPLFASLGFASSGSARVLSDVIARGFALVGLPFNSLNVGLLMVCLLVTSATVFLAQAYYSTRLQAEYAAAWQRKLFKAVISARWSYLRLCRAGDITAALTTEPTRVERAFYRTNLVFSSVVTTVIQVAIAAAIAPVVTVMILLVGACLFYLTRPLTRRAVVQGNDLTRANTAFLGQVGELTTAMKLIKATATEGEAIRILRRSIGRIERLNFLQAFDVQIVRAAFEYMGAAAVAALLIIGPVLLGVEISTIIVVLAMFVRIFPRITGLRQSLQAVVAALPAYRALQHLYQSAVAQAEAVPQVDSPPPAAALGPARVRFDGVCVRGDDGTPTLNDIDFEVSPGGFTAIVGASGAGKTTLIDCAIGLVEPSSGAVLIDGVPLTALSPALWRSGIGYLGQEPVLFAGTIRENVTWGRSPATDEQVTAALKAAGAGFVFDLPSGIDTVLNERGGSLSGGERQRIALARAFYGTTRLLILDEATSAMDPETEAAIMAAVITLKARTTVLCVSHRLSTVREADEIVVLDSGRILERGRFGNLLARRGRFFALWNMSHAV